MKKEFNNMINELHKFKKLDHCQDHLLLTMREIQERKDIGTNLYS